MPVGEQLDELQPNPSRKRRLGDVCDEEVRGSADDFVVMERADLRHGGASSTNLVHEELQWEVKKRCLSGPNSRAGSADGPDGDIDCYRWDACISCLLPLFNPVVKVAQFLVCFVQG